MRPISRKIRSPFLVAALAGLFLLIPWHHARADQQELDDVKTKIHQHGAKWTATETSVSRLPKQERQKRTGANKPSIPADSTLPQTTLTGVTLPPSIDYRSYNYVTPVKDQGPCGSCWAFAATAALESQILMKTGTVADLSEQTVLSCSGGGSCSGGSPATAASFLTNTGSPDEQCFVYTATNNLCSNACANWQTTTQRLNNYQYVTTSVVNVDALKQAIVAYGPVTSVFAVYTDFFYYGGGVYSHVSGNYEGNHVVEVIGFDDAAQAFIAKNSWGTYWGEGGFFRIAYSEAMSVVGFGQFTMAYNATAPSCSYTISPSNVTIVANGGSGNINVTSGTGCNWSAAENVDWITIDTTSGSGNGTVAYSVAPNAGAQRTATITVAGRNFTVTQKASFSVSPTSASFNKVGGSGTIQVAANTGVNWNVSSSASWITVTSGAVGSGSSAVTYVVAPNSANRNRNGSINIGGINFSITQTKR